MPRAAKKPAPKEKRKAARKPAPMDEALDLTLQHIQFKEQEKKVKSGLSEIRGRLLELIQGHGEPSGSSHTITFEDKAVFAQRQVSQRSPSIDEDAAVELILKKYPKLKGRVFRAFDMEAFAKLALDGEIKRADVRKVTRTSEPVEKLVVGKVKHGKAKSH